MCRIRQEIIEREHDENTRLQMQKRRREGHVKRRKGQGGKDFEIARLDPRKFRTSQPRFTEGPACARAIKRE